MKQIQVLDQYNSLSVDDWCGLEEKEVLATDWLLSWLKMETPKEIDNTMLVCPHNLLDPGSVVNAKYVFSNAVSPPLRRKRTGQQSSFCSHLFKFVLF